ncbi:MAG: hypothetical protein ACFFG0_34620 [Candidatus Thorarchaeota archaeon]
METGKIDFIICEEGGAWYFESLQIPADIAVRPDSELVRYAKENHFKDNLDIIFIGVYWRDDYLDGISKN